MAIGQAGEKHRRAIDGHRLGATTIPEACKRVIGWDDPDPKIG